MGQSLLGKVASADGAATVALQTTLTTIRLDYHHLNKRLFKQFPVAPVTGPDGRLLPHRHWGIVRLDEGREIEEWVVFERDGRLCRAELPRQRLIGRGMPAEQAAIAANSNLARDTLLKLEQIFLMR